MFFDRGVKVFYLFLIIVLILTGVAAYNFSSNLNPNILGHKSDEINISLNGNVTTLQKAIDSGIFTSCNSTAIPAENVSEELITGNSISSFEIDVSIGGRIMNLQQAIDKGALGGGFYEIIESIPELGGQERGHSANEILIDLNGTKINLQEALDRNILGTKTCVSIVFDYFTATNGQTSSNGIYTWNVPSGVNEITVETVGAGGGGGGSYTAAILIGGDGGGGGGYGKSSFSTQSGETYVVSVGKGGLGGIDSGGYGGSPVSGTKGGMSNLSKQGTILISSDGGNGGIYGGNGGVGGGSTGEIISNRGGNGGAGIYGAVLYCGGAIGGSAGIAPNGNGGTGGTCSGGGGGASEIGNGGRGAKTYFYNSGYYAQNGNIGSGGGGGSWTGSYGVKTGADGGNGRVVISYRVSTI